MSELVYRLHRGYSSMIFNSRSRLLSTIRVYLDDDDMEKVHKTLSRCEENLGYCLALPYHLAGPQFHVEVNKSPISRR